MRPMKSFVSAQKQTLVMSGLFMAVAAVVGILIFKANALIILALGLSVISFMVMLLRPDFATMVVMFMIYTHISVISYKFHGVPQVVAGSVSLLICIPFAVYIFIRRESVKIDYTFLLMLLFFVSLMLSFFMAKDKQIASAWVFNFLFEGLLLYFLIINVVRRPQVLRGAVWALIVAGSLLGGLTLYQELSNSYSNNMGGLTQRNINLGIDESNTQGSGLMRSRTKVQTANRAGGPIGDPNRFAQIMVVLLPLALFRFLDEKTLNMKIAAGIGAALILAGMLLTYSRGGFMTIVVIVALMTLMRYIKWYQVLLSMIVVFAVVAVAAPGYFTRMDTIKGVSGLFSQASANESDAVILGRTTEMLAALHVFLDYPLVGVGPGQYGKFYSLDYMSNPDIAFRRITKSRRAHSLYLELAAETGILGLGVFMFIMMWVLYGLWRSRKQWKDRYVEYANYAAAFFLGLIGYLMTAVFLSLAYQRYLWVVVALSGATIHILSTEKPPTEEEPAQPEFASQWNRPGIQAMNYPQGGMHWQQRP